ncbi:cytochrome P450 [Streptomyces alanosinicus]|uniref:Cytochrome P450 n=1 Tax=Streptomyces alanosinicus TaxID=68171 RepID=A0A918YUW4_9ACTN|nr:cytochrome P450 [Streptomyces alanosinicus]GHE16187.1 cytochrome P450 [Streptomyces alanosinicus]
MTELTSTEPGTQVRAFPLERGCPFAPPQQYAELREAEPVSKVKLKYNGREAWLLTRYEDMQQMLRDPRFESDIADPGYPLQFAFPLDLLEQGIVSKTLFHMDPPVHTKHRMILMPELTARQVEAMRPRTQEIVDELIDAILAQGPGPVDLVKTLTAPLPSIQTAEQLDLPRDTTDLFYRWIALLVTQGTAEEHASANAEVEMLLHRLIAERKANPGTDLISNIIKRNDERGGELSDLDLSALVRTMIAGGHESTLNGMTVGIFTLLTHPEQAALLREHPELGGQAVDELMRYSTVSDHGTVRVAKEDAEIGGVLIKKGEGVICALQAANRDPRVFSNPDTLDFHRKEASANLAFGSGHHRCAGQTLVRMQMEVLFSTLLRRIPGLRLATPVDELPFKGETALIDGLHELPVTW